MKLRIREVKAYITGTIRYKLWYSQLKFLIPLHIQEQIRARIGSMKEECFNQGQCVMCGCKTTALQMANKSCDGKCYPEMLDKEQWWALKYTKVRRRRGETWKLEKNLFTLVKKPRG